MLDDFSDSGTLLCLRAALATEVLPKSARLQAEQLLERLETGVRVAVIGPSNTGKSQLCRALLGLRSAGSDPEVSVLYTATGGARISNCADGRIDKFLTQAIAPETLGPVRIVDFAPGGATDGDQVPLWLLEWADVVLWCTRDFGAQEASIWQGAPDALKDHSFLVLTKADILAEEGTLQSRIADLQEIVAEEFHSLLPTTTRQICKALDAGQAVGEKLLSASGVKALRQVLTDVVASGRRADIDSAMLFLERHNLNDAEQIVPDTPAFAQSSVPPEILAARSCLMERAFDLAELSFDEAAGDMTDVLQCCGSIAEDLVDKVSQAGMADALDAAWRREFEDASDKVMLMALENDTRSAADAATILLQLRRDLEFVAYR